MSRRDKPARPQQFGLIVVGDELLSGSRQDLHFAHFKGLLHDHGLDCLWHWLLPDDPEVLTAHLRFSMGRDAPVFVCGGIGATPDDYTRGCAAAAAGVALTRHPQAAALIEQRFGPAAYPERIAMADLPEGSELIPNAANQIPGFRLRQHHFLPGFPEMAWPMAQWVIEHRYPEAADPMRELAVRIVGVSESRLIPLMRRLDRRFPEHKLFSLPHLGPPPTILLGWRGRAGIEAAFADLRGELEQEGLAYETLPSK
ncbi:putative nuleotide-utilizing enzyme, moeA [Thioflavicoccus mobilis 8321]|uniref:Putative nuleotide-utilizing enzyme, moeA n=1 Tax=Thioflavicoccus mobilis 8321 TaxID=765912 RepID=L0GT68_9GAMM|nr:molybdopterin-binding protein [Thioflavicoccus mobilis]AGA88997.1 putative nuleotide-utilizing enzyme, moeA [Thioflavicoccus mobilis 8321]